MSSAGKPAPSADVRMSGPSVLSRLVVAVVVAGLVTGVVGSWLIAASAGRALRSQIYHQNENLASGLAKRLDDRILTRVDSLRTVATRKDLQQSGATAQSEVNVVLKTMPEINRLAVFNAAGDPIAAGSGTRLVSLAELGSRPDLLRDMVPGSFSAHLVGVSSAMVELVVSIESPPGTVRGALVAEIPLDELAGHFDEVQTGSSRTAFLVRQDGRILVHRDKDRVLSEEHFTVPEQALEPAGSFEARTADEGRNLYSAAASSIVPAIAVLQQQRSEAFASVADSTRNLAMILLAVMVVTVATVSVVGRHLLAPLSSMAAAARSIGRGERGARVPVGGYGEVGGLGEELNRMADSLEQRIAELEERKAAEEELRQQSLLAETLYDVGRVLTAQLDLKEVVQAVTDIATDLTGAQFGAFFYNLVNEEGESYKLYSLAGVSPEAFSQFPMPRNTDIFGPTFRGEGTVRSDDITEHPSFGRNDPYSGMPEGHLPVCSYLAVPVVSRHGEVLGGLFFGHERAGVFTERHEHLAEGIAAQAAIAIENARLYAAQRSASEMLQRSLLPARLPRLPGLQTAARYLPAVPGVEVGGDWYDVIHLPDGTVAVVVGDVVGRGIVAAGTMGQLCHAVRAFALEDATPGEVLARLNRFLVHVGEDEQIATVVYAVVNPAEHTLRIASAGHPPPLRLDADGSASFIELESGPPVGALPDMVYKEEVVSTASVTRLILYTDGLVEDRRMPLTEGLEKLRTASMEGPEDIEEFCDYVLRRLAQGRDVQDDIAVLAIGPGPEG